MKLRLDYVTNSSSASFVVQKRYLTPEQIDKIKNHCEEARKIWGRPTDELPKDATPDVEGAPSMWWADPWGISTKGDIVHGRVSMDNFPMHDFLLAIGVPAHKILYGDMYYGSFERDDDDSGEGKYEDGLV